MAHLKAIAGKYYSCKMTEDGMNKQEDKMS